MHTTPPTFGTTSGIPISVNHKDHFIPLSFQAHHYWSLSRKGWIKFPNSPPNVIWIPPQFQQLLWRPQNTCIISRKGYTKLSFLDCVYGEQWSDCIEDSEVSSQ
ncbi:hypothetical protein BT96DRAFT_925137 [Gymnopus androsaceus JB14]|uniref:Uncharacterized protein n=1 Tax=Gymnopus androsaceus JB14 TaxID=1447944 RepID=A0A6A4H0C7_9AGAR|nr:hypothetical protein BT96DRAFT_925137 [Gymnopus androsaceus JB14]